ncbi:SLOG family protein [Paenibacillus sp. GYB003]|uniref:SLOG family protein n=1 Tax=Paenibacillus sp. GYB003 TaxID=2994392 RepID=UPI002F963E87
MKNLLVTGYRAHELNIFDEKHKGIGYIKKAIAARLEPLIEEGLEWIVTPGQYGVDLWACEAAFELKKRYPRLKCSIVAAYLNPDEKWKEEKQRLFRDIVRQLDYYGTVSNQPYSGVWQLTARDDLLFRKTDGILLFYDEERGEGSPRFYKRKALDKQAKDGYRYMWIGSDEVQSIADEETYSAYD